MSEMRAPSGVRNDVAAALVGGVMMVLDDRPIRREIYAMTTARLGDWECRYAAT